MLPVVNTGFVILGLGSLFGKFGLVSVVAVPVAPGIELAE